MMKLNKKLKFNDFDQQVEVMLRNLLGCVPFLKVNSIQREAKVLDNQVDWLIELESGERHWNMLVESKFQGQPRNVMNGLLQLQQMIGKANGMPYYGVIAAPFLSEESKRLCTEAGIGYADLAGNVRLSFDQIFIERQAAGNPFREKRLLRSLFTAKGGRVLRVLLTPPLRSWKVVDLEKATGVSLGQVSNVRKSLLDQGWAVVNDEGLFLSKPEELARAWQDSYKPRSLSCEKAYTLLHGEELENAIRATLAEAGQGLHAILASYSAANWLAPYARQSTQFFYADKQGAAILKRHLQLQSVPQGENVIITEPLEDDVFSGRVEAAPGIWCSGLVQTWLDLSNAGERGSEAAEHLLQEKLLPAWNGEVLNE